MSKPAKKKSLPYADTKVDPDTTKLDITKMLKANGIKGVQWTQPDLSDSSKDYLKFAIEIRQRDILFEIRPPKIRAVKKTWNKIRGKYEMLDVFMAAQAFRMVYWYLEIKLKAIEYGLVSIEQEFLNNMLPPGADPNSTVTIGDIISERLQKDQEIFKLEAPQPKQVDADYQVKEERS